MDWEKIKKEYETTNLTLKALAEKHNVKIGTLKSRKSREGWSRDPTKKDATKKKEVATPQPIIESDELNDKQKMFCLYYIKYFNATKAYQKAYGVDRNTAESIAYRLMGKDGVKREIERLKQERFNGVLLDAQAVLQKYIDIAFADITDFATFGKKEIPTEDEEGNPVTKEVNYVDFKESTEVDGTIITEVKKGKDGVSVKLADKMKALEFLAKYTDFLSENDRKKLQLEKMKAETELTKGRIDKTKAEIERLNDDENDSTFEIIIKDKGER
ncbi:terminase small subunit [Bacillus swezeyi]|uniref:Terminase small subunit n=1 Tax=Bacillus swezeyi TaxID=1925020 RepID=A0A5M8RVV8_9BACI|nr:terminase small subunit [Bacillus swezeyi]KAA6450964.1 terminase small subunit [Bacillus swezeyi]